MAANLVVKDTSDITITSISFTDVTPGTPSSPTEVRLYNESGGGVTDANSPKVSVLQLNDENGDPTSSGLRPIDEGWLEIRFSGNNSSGISQPQGSWIPMTGQKRLALPTIPVGEYVGLDIRYSPPASAPADDVTFYINGDPEALIEVVPGGASYTSRDGVLSEIGNWGSYSLCWADFDAAAGDDWYPLESSPNDQYVNYPALHWVHNGRPYTLLAGQEELTNLDGSGAALAAGEEYWALLTLADGQINQTKSDKATAPIADTEKPDLPEGEVAYCYVRVPFGLAIAQADIEGIAGLDRFEIEAISGLTMTLAAAKAFAGNRLYDSNLTQDIAVADATTNYVWFQPSNSAPLAVTSTLDAPRQDAVLLYTVVAAGGVITSITDNRHFVGRELHPIRFFFDGTLTNGDTAYAMNPAPTRAFINLPKACVLHVIDPGSGNAAGEMRVDISHDDGAGGWTTLFTSSGSDDRRPTFYWNDAAPYIDSAAIPEVNEIGGQKLMKAELVEVTPFDGTGPVQAVLTLWLEVV